MSPFVNCAFRTSVYYPGFPAPHNIRHWSSQVHDRDRGRGFRTGGLTEELRGDAKLNSPFAGLIKVLMLAG